MRTDIAAESSVTKLSPRALCGLSGYRTRGGRGGGDGEEEGLTSILTKAQGAHNLLPKGNNLIIQSQAVLRSEDQTVAV